MELEAMAMRRELAAADPDRYRPDLATSLNSLGNTLSSLWLSAQALTVAQKTATIRRELGAADPDWYRPDVARSLTILSATLSRLGRGAEAVAALARGRPTP
jgi:hypothetical protein